MVDLDAATDAALLVGVGRWSEPALAELYRRHGGAVHALARRVLGSDAAADDVTQEVFIALWDRPERFDPERASLRTFLLTVAHGRAVDALRSESSRAGREQRSAARTATGGYDLEHHAWDLAVADQVKRAVGALPAGERQAIELAYFAGRTYREVAELLRQPEGTIKSRIRTGLQRLRVELRSEGEERWAGR